MLTFIDFFAGIGGFRRGMELTGHKCVGFCEFDKFAVASYTAMHLMTDGDRERLAALPKNKRVAEAGKEEYRHGEWYANDVRRIFAEDIPRADCWCFGFPCQDISVAGKQAGLRGNRSSLFFRIIRLINDLEEKDRPTYLLIENVKNLLSVNRGWDFLAVLAALDESGYDAEWQVVNSAGYVPQNRERVFIVGHLRGRCSCEVFPFKGADRENTIFQLGNFLPTKKRDNPNQGRVYDPAGIAPCLNQMGGGGREPHVSLPAFCDMSYGKGLRLADKACCLQARYNKGVCGRPGETSGIAVPVNASDRGRKQQTHSGFAAAVAVAAEGGHMGRRFKENGEPMFTLTAQDRHGVMIDAKCLRTERTDFGKSIRKQYESKKIEMSRHKFLKYSPRTDGCTNTLSTVQKDNLIMLELRDGGFAYAVWYEEYGCYVAIRRLTPRECFRLQGWADVYFERAALINSDSQLYRQAGNGVTVPVVRTIAERMDMEDEVHKKDCNGRGVPV